MLHLRPLYENKLVTKQNTDTTIKHEDKCKGDTSNSHVKEIGKETAPDSGDDIVGGDDVT